MKIGESRRPRPDEFGNPLLAAIVGGVAGAAVLLFVAGPVFALVGLIVGGMLGWVAGHYADRIEGWRVPKPGELRSDSGEQALTMLAVSPVIALVAISYFVYA